MCEAPLSFGLPIKGLGLGMVVKITHFLEHHIILKCFMDTEFFNFLSTLNFFFVTNIFLNAMVNSTITHLLHRNNNTKYFI
jgi:hypothetical protein